MKLSLTVLAVAGVAVAADYANYAANTSSSATASSASASATPSSKIPSSISPGCSTFLSSLNTAPGIQSCVTPLLNALKTNDVSSIASVCSTASSNTCSDSTMRSWLTDFKNNCTAEIVTSPNPDVVNLYDVLYVVKPFTNAVCAKDGSGKYCLSQLASNSSAKSASGMANAAQTPLVKSDGTPDAEAFGNANVLFLGANSDMNSAQLCTTCTKNVLTSYISWESSMPPAYGLSKSPLLSSQAPLWAAVQKTCPADFISGTLSNAGATPGAPNGASTSSPAKGAMVMLALVAAGVMAL